MTEPDRDNSTVRYTVKELLADIKREQTAGFARLETAMDGKADKADLVRLETRQDSQAEAISEHRERIESLELVNRDELAMQQHARMNFTRWQRFGAFVVGAGVVITALISMFAVLHVI